METVLGRICEDAVAQDGQEERSVLEINNYTGGMNIRA